MADVAAQAELPRERGRSQPGARRAQSKSPGKTPGKAPGKSPGKTPRSAEQDQAAQAGLDLLRVLGWLVVHDVALADRPEVAADHVVVGPSGVYVVNNTPWVGPVNFHQGMLIANGAPRTEEIDEVAATADAVRKVLGGVPVAGVLCLIHSESVAGVAGEVAVCSTENILDLLTNQPSVIDGATQQRVARALTAAMTSGGPRTVSAPVVVALPSAKHRHRPRLRLRRTAAEEIAEDFEALGEVASVEVAEPEVATPVVQASPPPPPPPAPVSAPVAAPQAPPPPPVVRAPAAPPKEERPQVETADAEERERLEAVRREAAEERRRAVIAERRAQEERALFEAERKNVDEAREQARIEQQRQQEELQAERRRAAEERAQVEAERANTAEERARVEAEREKADEAREEARLERQRLADQLAAERQSVAEQQERAETERRKAEAERRKAAEDQERVNVERARVAEDRRLAEQAQAKALAERKRAVEERRQADRARARAEAEGKKAARERADAEREAAKRVAADRAASARIEAARQAEVARITETATTSAPPVSSFTATVPVPAEVESAREPRRTLRTLLPAIIAAVVIVIVVAVVPRVPGWVEWGKGLVGSGPVPAFGTTVPVEQSAFHPALQLFAGAPARTQATRGSTPAGTQLVAVRLRLENAGADKWAVALSSHLVATDSLGVQYHVARGVTAIKAGRLFAPTVKVSAQGKAAGFVTFAVPSGRSITRLELQLSSDKTDTVAWGSGH